MKKYRIERTDQPDLRFAGELIAATSGRWHNGREENRYYDLSLYRTTAGKLIAVREYVSHWQGESGSSEALVCETETEVIDYLGHDDLAKEIYHEAEIENVEEVA